MAGEQSWSLLKYNRLNINYCIQLKVIGYVTVSPIYMPCDVILPCNYCHKTPSNKAQMDLAEYQMENGSDTIYQGIALGLLQHY